MKWLGVWRINRDSIDFKWGYFSPSFGLAAKLHRGGYFDSRYAITFHPIWGCWHIKLPFSTKLAEGCDLPEYGVAIHNDTFWIYTGGDFDSSIGQCTSNKWITWYLPWFAWEFEFHHWASPNGAWVDGGWENKDNAYHETHDYKYVLKNGDVQQRKATIREEERQWHRKWFPWVKMNRRTIDVEFNEEVGEKTGSWKGGCTGCGYDMEPGESMVDTLRRMEKERKF